MSDTPEFMTAAELKHAAATLGAAGRLAASVDWDRYLRTINRAETIGPILDPTMFRYSPHGLRGESKKLAELLKRVVEQWKRLEAAARVALKAEARSCLNCGGPRDYTVDGILQNVCLYCAERSPNAV